MHCPFNAERREGKLWIPILKSLVWSGSTAPERKTLFPLDHRSRKSNASKARLGWRKQKHGSGFFYSRTKLREKTAKVFWLSIKSWCKFILKCKTCYILAGAFYFNAKYFTCSNQVRGEASTVSVTTEDGSSRDEESSPSGPPSPVNLRFDQIERTSIRVQWDIPFFTTPVDYYRYWSNSTGLDILSP